MATWHCMKNCGACCHLDPSERPDLEDYLSPEELAQYLSLVGKDGWCVHFDRASRECTIYSERPGFCRVEPDRFARMYGIELGEFDEFAVDCCHQHIEELYGVDSPQRLRYDREM
ncbi:YkgJ family cysteine cluster protein [Lusitaniella coriacea LEGE 07157]|uniref:YkgJ family cysteine cluster protein n=1 Tax=Lusitaniella coriacea LEGE 07157 TaxID=945747 RepID=A0A8J7AZD4_9CYAN|nr:YkgJ family cysteine cluster protein [Lusitaniella coriacea]MBE9115499.1 YkgJ family cysteine cluster protein [Lusitaniella coriacea LEGE 07157]